MLDLFGFGKRHRRPSRVSKKHVKKPPAALLRMCRKLKIKTTIKKGSRRVYKSVSVLKKLLRHKKKMLLRKKKMLLLRKKKKTQLRKLKKRFCKRSRNCVVRRYRREEEEEGEMEFGAPLRFGAVRFGQGGANEFGASARKRRRMGFGLSPAEMLQAAKSQVTSQSLKTQAERNAAWAAATSARVPVPAQAAATSALVPIPAQAAALLKCKNLAENACKDQRPTFRPTIAGCENKMCTEWNSLLFGKRRPVRARRSMASRKKAMTAFRKFYKRYCKVTPVRRGGMRFGEGGNPPLWRSMGYEFCPLGQGGVLETTGLFASPCTKTVNQKVKDAELNAVLPTYDMGLTGLTGLSGMFTPVMSALSGTDIAGGAAGFGNRRRGRKPTRRVRKSMSKKSSRKY